MPMATTLIAYRELHPWSALRETTQCRLWPGDWQPVLASRGFVAMLEHWYGQIDVGRADGALVESYLKSHRLAERPVALAKG